MAADEDVVVVEGGGLDGVPVDSPPLLGLCLRGHHQDQLLHSVQLFPADQVLHQEGVAYLSHLRVHAVLDLPVHLVVETVEQHHTLVPEGLQGVAQHAHQHLFQKALLLLVLLHNHTLQHVLQLEQHLLPLLLTLRPTQSHHLLHQTLLSGSVPFHLALLLQHLAQSLGEPQVHLPPLGRTAFSAPFQQVEVAHLLSAQLLQPVAQTPHGLRVQLAMALDLELQFGPRHSHQPFLLRLFFSLLQQDHFHLQQLLFLLGLVLGLCLLQQGH